MSSFYGVVPYLLAFVALFADLFSHLARPIACIFALLPLLLQAGRGQVKAGRRQEEEAGGRARRDVGRASRQGRKQAFNKESLQQDLQHAKACNPKSQTQLEIKGLGCHKNIIQSISHKYHATLPL